MKTIDLEKIFNTLDPCVINDLDDWGKHQVISRFKEVAMQVLELAAENAKTNPFSGGGTLYWDTDNINKQSILDTIKQVK